MNKKRATTSIIAIAAAGSLLFTGCSDPTKGGSPDEGNAPASDTITVSSANFVSSEIVGNLYAEALKAAGFDVETKFNIGSREAYIPALTDGSIDLIPDYTGNLLLYFNAEGDTSSPEALNAELATALDAAGLAMGEPAPAEDKDSLVVTKERAAEWSLSSLDDLAEYNDELIVAGTPEFKEREVGLPGLESNYGILPKEYVAIADGGGPATVQALLDGSVHAANIYTGSASIPANNFVVLDDPKFNFPSQNVIPVLNAGKASPKVLEVLDKVSAKLTTEAYIALNDMVTGDRKLEPREAALEWLTETGLI